MIDPDRCYDMTDACGPMPDCMMPDGGDACDAFRILWKQRDEALSLLQKHSQSANEMIDAWEDYRRAYELKGPDHIQTAAAWGNITRIVADMCGLLYDPEDVA